MKARNHGHSLVGTQLGKLTIVSYLGPVTGKKTHKYKVACSCGTCKEIKSDNLFRGPRSTKSCGCNRLKALPDTTQQNSAYDGFKRSARKRKIEVFIDKDQWLFLSKQECYYCGIVASNCRNPAGRCRNAKPFLYNGIDRIDSTQGYTLENCVPCCKDCNYAKRLMSKDAFINLARRIVFHQDSEKIYG